MERRLAAILAVDVVGFSRLMEADEAGTLAALKSHRAEFIDPEIAGRGGRIVKLMGDGALVEFPSVVDAVECAVAVQIGMAARNAGVSEGPRIIFRIGVNLGDVIVEGDDIYGDGVNVAARLEALAEPGGVCVSGTVQEHIAGKLDHAFADDGDQAVKNISRPVRVWRWSEDVSAPSRAPSDGAEPSPAHDRPAIAVLPFTNMSGDPEQEYFSDGIGEDIITALSRFHEFAVIARNSSFQYKGKSPKIEDVARNLGVRYVIEGSVRRAGERVRVTAQLIDARNGSHIWADRYDRDLTDIFAIQDEVTEAVVARVADSVKVAGAAQSRSRPTDSITAYDLVLQSRPYRTAIKRSSNAQAASLLNRAIAIDPDYALAYASLAFVLVGDCEEGWTTAPDKTLRDALAAARKAVSLDDADGYNHASLAYVHQTQGDFDRALNEAKIALSLNPNNVNIVMTAGWISIVAGDPESGIAYVQRARRLNPYMGGFELWTLGLGYLDARRYEDAVEVFLQASNPPTNLYLNLAICYAFLDRAADARAALETFLDHAREEMTPFPGDDPRAWRAYLEHNVVRQRKETFEHIVEGARRAGLPVAPADG